MHTGDYFTNTFINSRCYSVLMTLSSSFEFRLANVDICWSTVCKIDNSRYFSPSSPWPQNNAFSCQMREGTRLWADERRRLCSVRTGRLQFCCEILPSLASRVDVSHLLPDAAEIPELALKELFPEMGAACGLVNAMAGESRSVQGCFACEGWAAPLWGCAVQGLSVPRKRPRCGLQAEHRALGGEADTAHLLLAVSGPWLPDRAPWAHRVPCQGKCSVKQWQLLKEKWHLDLKDLFAVRPEEYMWLHWAQAAPRASYYMTVAINKRFRD